MRPPEQVGEFVVEDRLGEGGMGAVYRVVHKTTGARQALKLLTSPQDPEALRRFAREGEALAAVGDHPNVVRVHAAGEWSGRPYLLMQLCTGGDLNQRLREGPLAPLEAARIVADVARGIAHVHARGIVHRDLKPENVLFDEAGQTRVSDFGLAKVAGAGSLTATGTIMGTPAYMAPEQANDGRDVDARADVWGLGGILIAALTGRPPYAGASPINVLAKLMSEPPRWPSIDQPGTPPALEAIVRRAMARRREDRYASAALMAADLERFLTGGEVEARRPARRALVALGVTAAVAVLLAIAALATQPQAATAPPLPAPPVRPIASALPTPTIGPPASAPTWSLRPPETSPLRVQMPWEPRALLFLDATRLLVAGDSIVRLVDTETSETLSETAVVPCIRELVLAGGKVYVGADSSVFGGGVYVLTQEGRKLTGDGERLVHFEDLNTIACSADGRVLAVLDEAGRVHALSLPDGRSLGRSFAGPTSKSDARSCLAVSADGLVVACGHEDGLSLLSVGAEGLTESSRVRTAGRPTNVVFAAVRTVVVGTDFGALQLCAIGSAPVSIFDASDSAMTLAHEGPLRGLAVIGTTLISMSGGLVLEQNDLRAWDLAGRRQLWRLPGRQTELKHLTSSPDGRRCAVSSRVGDSGGLVEVWAER